MAHFHTLRISLAAAFAVLTAGSVASAADWEPRAAIAGSTSEIAVADSNWQPRSAMQAWQLAPLSSTDAGWAPRSAIGGLAPAELADADMNTATWKPRATIANLQALEPVAIAGWTPRGTVATEPKAAGQVAHRRRGAIPETLLATGDVVSTSAIRN